MPARLPSQVFLRLPALIRSTNPTSFATKYTPTSSKSTATARINQSFFIRPLSSTSFCAARKDAQDKDSLKPEPNEYSKSGSDDEAARIEQTAFDPSKTSPEAQHDSAGAESGGDQSNPLNVSPANQEVSKPRGQQEGGHEGSSAQSGQGPSDRSRTSGGGSPSKGGSGQKYQ